SESIDLCSSIYRRCATVVSNRLHALLLAAHNGARPLALIDPQSDSKILGIFQDAGWEDLVGDAGKALDSNRVKCLANVLDSPLPDMGQRQALIRFFNDLLAR